MSDGASLGKRPFARTAGRPDYLLSNGHQSVLPQPLSEAKTWVVWIEVARRDDRGG